MASSEDYWSLPEGVRAELIDGELWDLAAPSRVHQRIVSELSRRNANHILDHRGSCQVYPAPFAVNLFADDSTIVEPDISVICDVDKLSYRGCEGSPDLVVEVVSPSSIGMDYVSKLNLYREAGTREYWVCDPLEKRTLVYAFGEVGDARLTIFPFADSVTSTVFPTFTANLSEIVGEA